LTRERVKEFWYERAKSTNIPRMESQVNFESNAEMADLRVHAEICIVEKELPINRSDTIVDLGAGNGRFSMLFAPKAKKVIAVEYIDDFAAYISREAERANYKNIEVINTCAEDYCQESVADIIFVSGLLHYLDSEQFKKTVKNIYKTLKHSGRLFLRETVSVLENEFIVDKFSEELGTYYYSLYRTNRQLIDAFTSQGFCFLRHAPFFEDGNALNKRVETRLYYFSFAKEG